MDVNLKVEAADKDEEKRREKKKEGKEEGEGEGEGRGEKNSPVGVASGIKSAICGAVLVPDFATDRQRLELTISDHNGCKALAMEISIPLLQVKIGLRANK